MKMKLFSFEKLDTPIHRLSGLTKLIAFLLLTFAVMFSYDIRVITAVMIFSFALFKISKIKFSQIKLMIIYVASFVVVNAILSFIFSPYHGTTIYGTRNDIVELFFGYTLTYEQLFYQVTKIVKYASVVPLGIIFLFTTDPSEFAASLNKIGISYKASYAVALTLRYFPDIQRNYNDISLSQQARGLELSKKAKLIDRFKNAVLIMIPLVFSTLDRIEVISNAMDLRGFGKNKGRTWYSARKLKRADYIAITTCVLIFLGTICVSIFINKSRFYNPFI